MWNYSNIITAMTATPAKTPFPNPNKRRRIKQVVTPPPQQEEAIQENNALSGGELGLPSMAPSFPQPQEIITARYSNDFFDQFNVLKSGWTKADFETLSVLGVGAFGSVHKCRNRRLVIKNIFVNKDHLLALAKREVQIHFSTCHPNIVQCHGVLRLSSHQIGIVFDRCCGDLHQYIHSRENGRLQLHEVSCILGQITNGLAYLESLNISHRDIKPENILIARGDRSSQLTDFGWAIQYGKTINDHWRHTRVGTPEFIPPEMIPNDRRYHARFVDRWALGVLAYELVESTSLFEAESREETFQMISEFKEFDPLEGAENYWLNDFCARLMQVEGSHRISFRQAQGHPFLELHNVSPLKRKRNKPKTGEKAKKRAKTMFGSPLTPRHAH